MEIGLPGIRLITPELSELNDKASDFTLDLYSHATNPGFISSDDLQRQIDAVENLTVLPSDTVGNNSASEE